MGIFDIHHLVTNVIGRFYEIHQRVPAEPQGLSFFAFLLDAKFLGYFLESSFFTGKETELLLAPCQLGREGIFYNGSQCGVSQYKASRTSPLKLVCQQTEGVGISFK